MSEEATNPSKADDLILEEYKSARSRISSDIDEINKSEIYFLAVIGALYFFLFQFKVQHPYLIRGALFTAFALACFSCIRYSAHRYVIKTHEGFCKTSVEPIIKKRYNNYIGLATYYDKNSPKYLKPVRYFYHAMAIVITVVIFVQSLCCLEKVQRFLSSPGTI